MEKAKEICMLPPEVGPCRFWKEHFTFSIEKGTFLNKFPFPLKLVKIIFQACASQCNMADVKGIAIDSLQKWSASKSVDS